MKPLEGFTILDFSQFLAGPFASLRLADLGASVIKARDRGFLPEQFWSGAQIQRR